MTTMSLSLDTQMNMPVVMLKVRSKMYEGAARYQQ